MLAQLSGNRDVYGTMWTGGVWSIPLPSPSPPPPTRGRAALWSGNTLFKGMKISVGGSQFTTLGWLKRVEFIHHLWPQHITPRQWVTHHHKDRFITLNQITYTYMHTYPGKKKKTTIRLDEWNQNLKIPTRSTRTKTNWRTPKSQSKNKSGKAPKRHKSMTRVPNSIPNENKRRYRKGKESRDLYLNEPDSGSGSGDAPHNSSRDISRLGAETRAKEFEECRFSCHFYLEDPTNKNPRNLSVTWDLKGGKTRHARVTRQVTKYKSLTSQVRFKNSTKAPGEKIYYVGFL